MEDTTYEKNVYVQQVDCIDKAQCFSDVSYDVKLNLPRGGWYSGCVIAKFKVNKLPAKDLFLDFRGIKIANYEINGQPVQMTDTTFKNHHIVIPTAMLQSDQVNTAQIFFLNKYRNDGVGLHSFVDKVDKQQYLYTQFEADFCHYVFPCFDQPDLKATWKLSCQTEADWTVIAKEAVVEEPTAEVKGYLEQACALAAAMFIETANTEPANKK